MVENNDGVVAASFSLSRLRFEQKFNRRKSNNNGPNLRPILLLLLLLLVLIVVVVVIMDDGSVSGLLQLIQAMTSY